MGRQDYEGAPISGVSGDVAGSTTSDYGSSGSLGQTSSGLSFSGADLYGGGDTEQEVRQRINLAKAQQAAIQRLQAPSLPQTVQQGFAAGTSPFAQLSVRGNLNQLPNFGILSALNALGQRTASGIMERIQAGGTPVYDRTGQIVGVNSPSAVGDKIGGYIEDKFGIDVPRSYSYFGRPEYDPQQGQSKPIMDDMGNIIGYEGGGFPDVSDDGGFVAPEATAVAAAQPEPEKSMIEQGYRYPAGGYYPEEGRFMRTGLLDVAPTIYGGLLAGYDPTQFGAMNVGFRQPTDVSLYQDPYDVSGYALI